MEGVQKQHSMGSQHDSAEGMCAVSLHIRSSSPRAHDAWLRCVCHAAAEQQQQCCLIGLVRVQQCSSVRLQALRTGRWLACAVQFAAHSSTVGFSPQTVQMIAYTTYYWCAV